MRRTLAPLFALLLAAPALADKPGDEAKELTARIQKFYETTKDLHAKFDQEYLSGLGQTKKSSGEVWLKKPGRMRWEYQKPEKKLMVADGTALWVYEPDDEQAFKQDLRSSQLPSSVTFLWGAGKLTDEFAVTIAKEGDKEAKLGGAGDVVLKLVPQKPTAQYRTIAFVVDPKSAMVKESVVYDQQGGANHITFKDVELNKSVPDAKFAFTPPAGTRILRP